MSENVRESSGPVTNLHLRDLILEQDKRHQQYQAANDVRVGAIENDLRPLRDLERRMAETIGHQLDAFRGEFAATANYVKELRSDDERKAKWRRAALAWILTGGFVGLLTFVVVLINVIHGWN